MGYLIDAQGHITSGLAVGALDLLALAAPVATPRDVSIQENGHKAHQGNRSLVDSRINRSGLAAGMLAPDFCLPQPNGGEIALTAYRGRQLLLVFSDPNCGPCDQLASELERLHHRAPNLQVLVVSRGDPETNREKMAKHGWTFPVVLQRQWEISRAYGMFATPIGYLINEDGIIAADVAVGVEPIVTLAATATTWTQRKEGVPMA
jgi:peroxiredoxin